MESQRNRLPGKTKVTKGVRNPEWGRSIPSDGAGHDTDSSNLRAAVWDNVDRKSTRLNSSHLGNSYAVFCLKKNSQNGRLVVNMGREHVRPTRNSGPSIR